MSGSTKRLSKLLAGVDLLDTVGPTDTPVTEITFDSREVSAGSVYVAIPGTQIDGHKFIDAAVSAGARAIICERLPDLPQPGITFGRVTNARAALGIMAANFYDHPSSKLHLVGVTGTNGKTTVATMLYRLARSIGYKSGLFSTIRNEIDGELIAATHTTPDALQLNRLMSEMVQKGCTYCFMEVTSHAIHQDRISGLNFAGGLFTNLSHDHLDYHGSMDEYFRVKKRFFDDLPSNSFALTNLDDSAGLAITADCKAKVQTYSLVRPADFSFEVSRLTLEGLTLRQGSLEINSRLVGRFNAYNVAAIWGACSLLGFPEDAISAGLEKTAPVAGRFDWTKSEDDVLGVVDFAHTPDALIKILASVREIRPEGRLITVFGCGGNKDREKRPHMGKSAVECSDLTIVTNDNPRKEDPLKIIVEVCSQIERQDFERTVVIISDRLLAIKAACDFALRGDIIIVAGRGHEEFQELYSEKRRFVDLEVLEGCLSARLTQDSPAAEVEQ